MKTDGNPSSPLTGEVVVDAARVAEIRQAIAAGLLPIRPEVIAEKLLETVRELLEGQPEPR